MPASQTESGEIEVEPEQATVVVRIFSMYRDGMSPRAITEQLNAERVPSPGSTWNRTNRRNSGWAMSGIAGDVRRGTGILNNPLYTGRVIWNRFRWVRSASDSSKRRCVENPRDQWIEYEDPQLRIVLQGLWDQVKGRQRTQSERIGARIRGGLAKSSAKATGRSPRYLFSSLLKCGACGASYTIRGRSHYACARHLDGRCCSQTIGVKCSIVEPALLQGIKDQLASDEMVQAAAKAAHRLSTGRSPATLANGRPHFGLKSRI